MSARSGAEGRVRSLFRSICVVTGLALSGCTERLQVGYICDAPGAELYEDYGQSSRKLGTCPMTVTYNVPDRSKEQGYVLLRGVTAVWVSGVSQSLPAIKVDLRQGYSQDIVFSRPKDAPGYENDAKYGRDVERRALQDDRLYSLVGRAAL